MTQSQQNRLILDLFSITVQDILTLALRRNTRGAKSYCSSVSADDLAEAYKVLMLFAPDSYQWLVATLA